MWPFLVQGTLYSDVIESGSATAAKIKSHHKRRRTARGDRTSSWSKPLRLIFKDEVRRVGARARTGPRRWSGGSRSPVRVSRFGSSAMSPASGLEILRSADAVLLEEIRRAGLYHELWQSFAILPAIRSVGVQGRRPHLRLPDRDPRGYLGRTR